MRRFQTKERLRKLPFLFESLKWSYYRVLRLIEFFCGTRVHEWIWKTKLGGLVTDYTSTLDHPHRAYLIEKLLEFAPFDSALEFGCNNGPNIALLAERIPQASIFGIDVNAEAIARGRSMLEQRGLRNVTLNVGNGEDLSFLRDKSIDVIFTDATLLYVGRDKIDALFSEMKRIARKALLFNEWNLPTNSSGGERSRWYYMHWIHDYASLLVRHFPAENIQVTKLPRGLWGKGGWEEFGALVTVKISD